MKHPESVDMDSQIAGDIELGARGDGFLARYTPHTHRPLTGGAVPMAAAWQGERVLHPSPAAGDPAKLDLHARVRESVRALLNTACDDWALISFFGIATHHTPDLQSVLVIVLRPDAGPSATRAKEIVLRTLDITNA